MECEIKNTANNVQTIQLGCDIHGEELSQYYGILPYNSPQFVSDRATYSQLFDITFQLVIVVANSKEENKIVQ